MALPSDQDRYDYRIVLERPNGTSFPLASSQGESLDAIRERLQELLDDPGLMFTKGWIERRPYVWETFTVAQNSRRTSL